MLRERARGNWIVNYDTASERGDDGIAGPFAGSIGRLGGANERTALPAATPLLLGTLLCAQAAVRSGSREHIIIAPQGVCPGPNILRGVREAGKRVPVVVPAIHSKPSVGRYTLHSQVGIERSGVRTIIDARRPQGEEDAATLAATGLNEAPIGILALAPTYLLSVVRRTHPTLLEALRSIRLRDRTARVTNADIAFPMIVDRPTLAEALSDAPAPSTFRTEPTRTSVPFVGRLPFELPTDVAAKERRSFKARATRAGPRGQLWTTPTPARQEIA